MDESARNFLPRVLTNLNAKLTSANLTSQRISDDKYLSLLRFSQLSILDTYTVTWSEQRRSKSKSSKRPPISVGFWDFLKEWMPTSSGHGAPGAQHRVAMIRCDGPCGEMVPYNSTKIIGLCEHVICRSCLKKAKAISRASTGFIGELRLIIDGGSGCPNRECYSDDLGGVNRNELPSNPRSSNKGRQWAT